MSGLSKDFDARIAVYRALRLLFITALSVLAVKIVLFDVVTINSSRMSPSIMQGDRVLVLRTPYLSLLRNLSKPPIGKPILFRSVVNSGGFDLLRAVAAGGDTLRIDSGSVVSTRYIDRVNIPRKKASALVPATYAPRDFFAPYSIPCQGETLMLNKLPLREFFLAASMIRQENRVSTVTVKPYLIIEDSVCNDYIITDFAFYHGRIDSVPESLGRDWFFWNRLDEYLHQKHGGKRFSLYFTLSIDNTVMEEYIVKERHLFMLADSRDDGFDSRYFGPVSSTAFTGRPVMVLWSRGKDELGHNKLRFKRFGRFIP